MTLSIVIPLLNESQSLAELHAEISRTCDGLDLDYEIVFVDDGSVDDSWRTIERLSAGDARVSGIRLRRNFGKAAALTAGMKAACATAASAVLQTSGDARPEQDGRAAGDDLIMILDADLQDDPAEIPRLLAKLNEGYDVVNGWKEERLDPWHKVYPSRVFNWMVSRLTGLKLHDHNCGFKLFRAEVANEIRIYGELHRFIPVLAHARGFRVAELPVHHRQRRFGHSKYGMRRFVRGFLDLLTVKFLTSYSHRPQHILGAAGLAFFGLGLLGLTYLAVVWILTQVFGADFDPIGNRPMLAYSIAALLLGAQALSLGLLAELLVAYTGREADTYSVAQRTAKALDVEVVRR